MTSLFRYSLALVFALVVCSPLFAQRERDTYTTASPSSFEVVGQVRIADTGRPAARIPVRLERFGGGIVDQLDTDESGRFRFAGIQRGYYRVILNVPGFQPMAQDADLQVMVRAFLAFELRPLDATSNLIDVIDARAPVAARQELVKGREALAKKTVPEAITHFERAITAYPEYYEAHLLLGTAWMDSREWTKAEQAFQRAVELKNTSAPANIGLGEVYWRQKRYDDAEKTLLAALKLDDKSWHGYFTLGRLYLEMDNIQKAAPAIGRTIQLKPDFAPAHLLAGNILLRVNQQERALAAYQDYLRLDPKGEFAPQARQLIEKLTKAIGERKQ